MLVPRGASISRLRIMRTTVAAAANSSPAGGSIAWRNGEAPLSLRTAALRGRTATGAAAVGVARGEAAGGEAGREVRGRCAADEGRDGVETAAAGEM